MILSTDHSETYPSIRSITPKIATERKTSISFPINPDLRGNMDESRCRSGSSSSFKLPIIRKGSNKSLIEDRESRNASLHNLSNSDSIEGVFQAKEEIRSNFMKHISGKDISLNQEYAETAAISDFADKVFEINARHITVNNQKEPNATLPPDALPSSNLFPLIDIDGSNLIAPDHLNDVETMRLIISDLNRRLQNAQHTIASQKQITQTATQESEKAKEELFRVSTLLRYELAKNMNLDRKYHILDEMTRMKVRKTQIDRLQQDLKIKVVDQQMTKSKLKLEDISKDKEAIKKLVNLQETRDRYVQQLRRQEEMVEELCRSCQSGNLQNCVEILEKGVSVNETDSVGFLPIHYACKYGHKDIVQHLLDQGSDPGTYITGKNPVEVAAKSGHVSIIRILAKNGSDVNDAGTNGLSPLLAAVIAGQLECIEELIELGADINVRDTVGNNCLHLAASASNDSTSACIRLLLQYGADMAATNLDGFTPFQLAVKNGNISAVEILKSESNRH